MKQYPTAGRADTVVANAKSGVSRRRRQGERRGNPAAGAHLQLPRSRVELVSGTTSRLKRFGISR
jgi:hypothetical protein